MSQFYMTLPSNSKAGNTASIFETNLPVNICLDGEWEVGLSEIIYANTWNNVPQGQNSVQFYDVKNNIRQIVKIPPARYNTIEDLIQVINQSLLVLSKREKMEYGSYITIQYSRFRRTTEIVLDSGYIRSIKFSPHLLYMLGFFEAQFEKIDYKNEKKVTIQAKHPPDMYGGLHYLYVYCDIVQPQIIGNVLAPILQVVNVEGDYMQIVNRVYITPNYIPVLKKTFNTLNIEIKNDLNLPIEFEFGKTIIKLHFKNC